MPLLLCRESVTIVDRKGLGFRVIIALLAFNISNDYRRAGVIPTCDSYLLAFEVLTCGYSLVKNRNIYNLVRMNSENDILVAFINFIVGKPQNCPPSA